MKVGLDIHGVIDRDYDMFSDMAASWIAKGHEVHIVTGQPKVECYDSVKNVPHTHFFSIVDHHESIGTPLYTRSDKTGWWMDWNLWIPTKGKYAEEVGLDLHIDDTLEYGKYFPTSCTFIHMKEGPSNLLKITLDAWQ
jgi:hypothetical protein